MRFVTRRLRRLRDAFFAALAEGTDAPSKVGLALGLGALIGSSPLPGLHTALAIGVAWLFRLNRVLCFLGSNVSFGPILGAIIVLEVSLGATLLGRAPPDLGADPIGGAKQALAVWWLGWAVVGPALFAAGVLLGWLFALRFRARAARPTEPTATPSRPASG